MKSYLRTMLVLMLVLVGLVGAHVNGTNSRMAWMKSLLDHHNWDSYINDGLNLPQLCRDDLKAYLKALNDGQLWASKSQTLSLKLISQPLSSSTSLREPTVRLGKRKPRSTLTNSARVRKSSSNVDIFNIRPKHSHESEAATVRLSSFFVNRVANGNERRTANTSGDYYIGCKVYRSDDAHLTDSSELWKKALVRLKLQTDVNSTQWQKLQQFIMSADVIIFDVYNKARFTTF